LLSSDIEIIDPRMRDRVLGNVFVEKLCGGMRWAEGPVWFGDGRYLVWSDIPNNCLMRWLESGHVEPFRQPSNYANGNTRDREGRLVSCEHGGRRVTRTELNGSVSVLVDGFEGKRFNSPNDVVMKSDGTIWFTDPDYGILTDYEGHRATSEIGACHVFRLDPRTGELERMTGDDYHKPNGIAFSPDENRLYVADTGRPNCIRVHDVIDGRRIGPGKVFAEVRPGGADGFRFDEDGNLWTSAGDGVQVYATDGVLLGKIRIPEAVSNLAFGGASKNRLFITATTSLYSIYVAPRGAMFP
jgi:gluconolactonase